LIYINLEGQSLLKLARTSNEVDQVAYWGKKHHQENSLLEQIWHHEKAMTMDSGYELGINSKQRKTIIRNSGNRKVCYEYYQNMLTVIG